MVPFKQVIVAVRLRECMDDDRDIAACDGTVARGAAFSARMLIFSTATSIRSNAFITNEIFLRNHDGFRLYTIIPDNN